jgi:hypothetical protein
VLLQWNMIEEVVDIPGPLVEVTPA